MGPDLYKGAITIRSLGIKVETRLGTATLSGAVHDAELIAQADCARQQLRATAAGHDADMALTGGGQDHAAVRLRVMRKFGEHVDHVAPQLGGHGVGDFRAVQAHQQQAGAGFFDLQGFVSCVDAGLHDIFCKVL